MESIPADFLAAMIASGDMDDVLVLDTRPFTDYNEAHVQESLNVLIPPIMKRRSGGFVSLETIIRSDEIISSLRDGKYKLIIAYDQSTEDICSAAKDSNLYVVMQSLKQQVSACVVYLKGGFVEIQKSNPEMTATTSSNRLSVSQLSLALPTITSVNKGPVEILPFLYLGDSKHASNRDLLTQARITHVLNVSTTCANNFEADFLYMNIPVQDNVNADLLSWFPSAIAFIDNVRKNNGKVLVHCQAGISRSATVCMAYLMCKNNLGLDNAYDHIRQRRSIIDPNLSFMRQLQAYEKELNRPNVRKNTITGQEFSPLTPSTGDCGMSWHGFSFPVPANCTPLVSPS